MIYWRIYNMLYVGSQDALVAYYPPLLDEGRNNYRRTELDIIL